MTTDLSINAQMEKRDWRGHACFAQKINGTEDHVTGLEIEMVYPGTEEIVSRKGKQTQK